MKDIDDGMSHELEERQGCLRFAGQIPNVDRWTKVSKKEWISLPNESGCYALFLENELQYIGQTGRLRERISQHAKYGYKKFKLSFDEIRFIRIKGAKRTIAELILISVYEPKINMKRYEETPRDKNYYFPLIDVTTTPSRI